MDIKLTIGTKNNYFDEDFTDEAVAGLCELYQHYIAFHGQTQEAITFVYDVDLYSTLMDCSNKLRQNPEQLKKHMAENQVKDIDETLLYAALLDRDLREKNIPLDNLVLADLLNSEFLCGKDYCHRAEFAAYLKKTKAYRDKVAEIDALLEAFA